ncbi:MAG: trypsin-like peptidase domain-containing protein [Rhodocyclaceae bacterium]|nr:trypsin-like peptidase domain-containing protein [Rhodocyclaceae bacterium]
MAKQTLYEVLGLARDASTKEIERACALHLRVLDSDPSIDDRENRATFVRLARDVLSDAVRRARYDAQLATVSMAETGATLRPARVKPARYGAKAVLLAASVVAVAVVLTAWQDTEPASRSIAEPAAAIPIPADDGAQAQPVLSDAVAPPLSPSTPPAAAAAAVSAPATVGKPSYRISIDSPDAELLKKLVWSVYGVVGRRGMGTGIMIDNEKLLTNCHVLAPNIRQGKIFAVNAVTREHAEVTEVAYLDHEDACLVKVPGLNGQAVPIGSTALLATGDTAHNIGYANGTLTASQGRFLGWMKRFGQNFLATSNYCDHGVSGGPLVDDEGRLIGLTTGGPTDRSRCYSLTVETIAALRFQSSVPLREFPENYVSNITRRNW